MKIHSFIFIFALLLVFAGTVHAGLTDNLNYKNTAQSCQQCGGKIIVIADESLNSGIVANAIGQLGIEIGGHCKEKLFEATVLHDAQNRVHYTDSLYPMANLAGTQKDMATFAQLCYDAGIQFFDFSDIMRKAHSDKQMQKGYSEKKTAEISYIAVGALVPTEFAKEFLSKLKLFGERK